MTAIERLQAAGLVIPEARVRHVVYVEGNGYLLRPIDAWGRVVPEWVGNPMTAFCFNARKAERQKNLLGWAPHKLEATVILQSKAGEGNNMNMALNAKDAELQAAYDRIFDLMYRDDGQAYKEAERFLQKHAPHLAERLATPHEEAGDPHRETVKDLRDKGYCVVMWNPSELGEADSGDLEDIVIQRGNEYLSSMGVPEEGEEEE